VFQIYIRESLVLYLSRLSPSLVLRTPIDSHSCPSSRASQSITSSCVIRYNPKISIPTKTYQPPGFSHRKRDRCLFPSSRFHIVKNHAPPSTMFSFPSSPPVVRHPGSSMARIYTITDPPLYHLFLQHFTYLISPIPLILYCLYTSPPLHLFLTILIIDLDRYAGSNRS
jgi:hypothetical protein